MAELATAYVSLRVSTGGMQGDVKKALTGLEPEAAKTGRGMGEKLSAGMGKTLKRTAIGVGVAGGAALAAGMTKGIGRLNSIEKAESKLKGLGNSASTVSGVMENALASVKGTAFGLEEAATVASSMVASGIKPGRELEAVLKTVGDTAAIAGTDMASMGDIFGKVAAKGKLQGNELFQLSQAGIPALQLLSSHLGKTSEEVTKMVSKGEIDFKTFSDAMAKGVGGAALEMGNTTSGALMNMMAAAGRVGATLAGPFFTQAGGAFRGVTDLLDGMNKKVGPVMDRFGSWIAGTAVPALQAFGESAAAAFKKFAGSDVVLGLMSDMKGVFSSLAGTAAEVWPSLVKIAGALGDASQALGVSAWQLFVAALQVGSAALSALTGPLRAVASVMEKMPHLVTAAVGAWMAFRTVPMLVSGVSGAVAALSGVVKPAIAGVSAFASTWQTSMEYARQASPGLSTAGQAMKVLGENAKSAGKGGVSALSTALGGPLVIGLAAVVGGLVSMAAHSQRASQYQDALKSSSEGLAESQREVAEALSVSGNEMSTEVWSALNEQISGTRKSMDEVSAAGPGFMGWMGAGIKGGLGLYGALKTANRGLAENAAGTIQATFEQSRMAGQSKAASEALSELGLTNEQIASGVYGSATAYGHLRGQLDMTTEGGAAAGQKLAELRSEFERQQALVSAVGPEYLNLQSALDVLADSAAGADDKLSAMRTTLEILGEIQISAAQNAAEVSKSVNALGDALGSSTIEADEFGRVFQNADGSLNGMNANTGPLITALSSMSDRLMATAVAGGDAQGVLQGIQPELEAMRGQAEAAGLDFDGMIASMGLTPESVEAMVKVNGLEEVDQDILAVANKLKSIEPGVETRVTLEGGQAAVDELNRVGIKVTEFDGETGEATVSVEARSALDNIWNTRLSLKGLDDTTAISDILAVNGQAQGKIWQTQGGLDGLDATDPLSTIMAENGQAQGAIGDTQGGLDNLGTTHPESKVTVDNRQAGSAITDVKGWLTGIPGVKDVTVRFRAIYEGFKNALGLGENSTGGAWSGSRSLPRFASGGHGGYRLPTSGPGTEVTDGFTAFDRNMVPAARLDAGEWIVNGRSSQKYNRELAQINAGTFPKLPGYKDGGRADAKGLLDFVHGRNSEGQARSLEGAPYVWGGVNWGDCSGAMSAIARFAVGIAPFAGRFATASQREALMGMGFKSGRGGDGDLRMGWANGGPGGGHTAGTLPDGTNVEMGGGRGNGQIGGPAAGSAHSQFTDHAYLPIHTWKMAGIEGADGLMPPGDTDFGPMELGEASNPGMYSSPGNSGQSASDGPRTWSDMAAGVVSELVGGQVSDTLGVFGVPDQLPPIVQAWQMLNEKPGGGPSDWDLSTAAAEVKRLDAAIKVREQFTNEARKAIGSLNDSSIGNALPSQVMMAEGELDKQLIDLERDRLDYERAQGRLEELLGSRAAAVATKDLTSSGGDVSKLSEALSQPPGIGIPDEILREMKMSFDPAGGAEQWRPMVVEALKRNGFAATKREQDLMIAQIGSESGGNPGIAQQILDVNGTGDAAGVGLLQIIPGTFAANRDPELPDDRRDPWSNMNAALRYYKGRYGMDLGAMWGKGQGYSTGGWINGSGTKDSVPLVGAPGEFIVNRRAAAQNREALEAMNAGNSVVSQSGGATYNIYAFDLDEAMATTARRESQHAQTYLGAR